jgi:hypothetical protein
LEVARATAWLELDREAEAIALLQTVVLHGNDQAARVRAAVVACEALVSQGQTSQAAAFVAKLKELEGGPEWELAEIRLLINFNKSTSENSAERKAIYEIYSKLEDSVSGDSIII